MVFSNMIVDITIFRRLFVFSQPYVQISASLTNVRGLAVAAFDLVYCFLSVVRFARSWLLFELTNAMLLAWK